MSEVKQPKRHRNDILLLSCVLFVAAVAAVIFFFTRTEGKYAAVIKNGTEIGRYSLSENAEIPIYDGETVTNVLIIKGGNVYISEANCPDKVCVNEGSKSKVGQTIICLPNKVVIKIIGSDASDGPDMVI